MALSASAFSPAATARCALTRHAAGGAAAPEPARLAPRLRTPHLAEIAHIFVDRPEIARRAWTAGRCRHRRICPDTSFAPTLHVTSPICICGAAAATVFR